MSARSTLLCLFVFLAAALLGPASALAANEPAIAFSNSAPATALLGTNGSVALTAKNPKGQPRGYNLTFRDVLPKNVSYVAGSASVAPRIVENKPAAGETTLIFENVSDLSANSEYTLGFEVKPLESAFTIGPVNGAYTTKATAYVSRQPRIRPQFDGNGNPVEGTFTAAVGQEATTKLSAIEIVKSEPSPEGEILRGLHEHQTTYTLTITNNLVKPTKGVVVDDYLPAGLEFLGCGTTDNTKDAPTNPGSKEEYAGSGPIDPGNAPTIANCEAAPNQPISVETELVDPDGKGPRPEAVYTHVQWSLGELAKGQVQKLRYVAAIPIRENTLSWPAGKPTAASRGQAANLDNNSGRETTDEEALINYSRATGKFEGTTEVEDSDELPRTAEDLAVQKSVDKATIAEGQISNWSLHIESSEYRFVNGVEIADLLPNGLCPLGEENYEGPAGIPTEPKEECNPTGAEPTVEVVGGAKERAKYTSVVEQGNGTFKLAWDQSTVPVLAQMAPSEEMVLKFPTRTRVDYQENFRDKAPVLTGDSWKNAVDIAGDDFARCAPNDPLCSGGGAKIFTEEAEGTPDVDHSEASQTAGGVTIDKTVRENTFPTSGEPVPVDCSGTYVQGLAKPLPAYSPGDKVCWELRVNFASDLYAGTPVVTDFLPPDEKYVTGSQAPVTGVNTVAATFIGTEAEGGSLEWTLGSSVESGSKVFAYRFATTVQKSTVNAPGEITGNLMKFSYSNSAGQTFPMRDRAEVERDEPKLVLQKGIYRVNGAPAAGNPANTEKASAHGGDEVTYRLDVANTGNLGAEEIEVWDRLPTGIECSDVKAGSITSGGVCEGGAKPIIHWTNLAVAKESTLAPEGKSTEPRLRYTLILPVDVAPSQTYTNTAGVRKFTSPTDTGGHFLYVPASNIDPEIEKESTPNTASIKDTATVSTAAAKFKKTRTTNLEQGGNNLPSQATIGEIVTYELTGTVPAGSVVFGSPAIVDELGTVAPQLQLIAGTATGTLNGGALPAGFSITETGNAPTLHFPAEYSNEAGTGDDTIKLTFQARVTDVAANARPGNVANKGVFNFKDQTGAAKSLNETVNTAIVEPKVSVAKSHAGGNVVKPGQIVEYTVTASNSAEANVSTANDSTLVDTVPAGMTPVNGTTPVENGKTVQPDGGVWNEGARTITWAIAEIAPAAAAPRHYSLRVNEPASAGSIFQNKVTLKTTSYPGENPGERTAASATNTGYEASAEDTVSLNEAELEKSVQAPKGTTIGDPLIYTVNLKLPPSIAFFDTTVEDHLPKGVAYDGTQSVTCASGASACSPVVPTTGTELEPGTEAGSPLLGWYFGTIEPSPVERVVTIVYRAHIAEELEAGVPVLDGANLENGAIGLYNGHKTFTQPPTTPPARSLFTNKSNEAHAKVEVEEPQLGIKKTVAETTTATVAQPGDLPLYTLTVTNSGDSAAYDVTVKDTNPQGFLREPKTAGLEGAGFFVAGSTKPLEWQIPGPIAPGASVKLQYRAKLAPSAELKTGDKVENHADIPLYFGVPSKQRAEEGAGRFREYTEDPSDVSLVTVALPGVEVAKTAGPGEAEEAEALIGKPFDWQVKVTNTSPVASLKGVDIVDQLPTGWEYVPGSSKFTPGGATTDPEVNGTELRWANVAELGPLASTTVKFKAVPTTALEQKTGKYVNTATASGEDLSGATGGGGVGYEKSDTATANLKTPGLEIKKTPDNGAAVAGEPSAYSIEVKNSGSATANSVEVSDLLGAGNQYTAGTATANPSAGFEETAVEAGPGAGETLVKWKIDSIGAGKAVTITVPVGIASSLADGTVLADLASAKSAEQPTPVTDPGSLDVTREADVSIKKSATPSTSVAGGEIDYKLEVENNGPSEATHVLVRDPLPAGTTFVSADAPCVLAAGVVECELSNFAAHSAAVERHIRVLVAPGTTGSIVNKAEVGATETDPEPANNSSEVTTPVSPEADVSIVKRGPAAPVLLGGTFTYTLEVENAGPSDAVAVKVEDPLPGQVELVPGGADTDTGSCTEAAPLVECELGTMAPLAKALIHITVKATEVAPAGELVENFASAESPTTFDPNLSNNESSVETEIDPATDLAILKTAPATVAAGHQLTYSLHVSNNGPSPATGVHVTDPLPAGTVFVSAGEGCAAASGTVTCQVGALAVGEARDLQIVVTVPLALAGQPLANTATVAGDQADPVTANDSSTAPTRVGPAADLAIAKTMGAARAGQPLAYTLAVTNHGPSTASAVTVHDTLPAGVAYSTSTASQGSCSATGAAVTCQLGSLASGASAQVTITVAVAVDTTGSLRNVATVEGPEPDPDHANNESAVEGPVGPPPASAPDLHVVKTASTSSPQVGQPFQYRVTVTNRGAGTARNVHVTDTLNGPAKVTKLTPDKGTCKAPADGAISCLIDTLAPHASAHIVYTVVAEKAGKLVNAASAMAANGEVSPADNHAVKDVSASAAPATYKLTKTAARKVVPGGNEVGFTLTMRNGPTAMTDVTMCDRLPARLVFVKAPGASFLGGRACWKRPFIAAGAKLEVHLTARAIRGFKWVVARNVATADAGNAPAETAAATVRIKPAFGGKPGGVTG